MNTPPKLTDEQIDTAIDEAEKVPPNCAGWVVYQRRAYARAIESAVNQQWLDMLAARVSAGWQRIETAPKDRDVLLWATRTPHAFIDQWGRYDRHNHPRITHWMPLPPAPDAAAPQPHPKQEPVAWIRKNGFRFMGEIEPQDESEVALYTAPQPQREWVGLMDEDILEAEQKGAESYQRFKSTARGQMISPADDPYWHVYRAIEAKLREKNTENKQ